MLWGQESSSAPGSQERRAETVNVARRSLCHCHLARVQSLFRRKALAGQDVRTLREAAKACEDRSSARLKVRLFQGAMEANTSLMTTSYPADTHWLTAP